MGCKVYLVTVFVESLRRSLNISQQDLSNVYEYALDSELNELSTKLQQELKSIVRAGDENRIGPKMKALFRANVVKQKIKLHEKLTDALNEIQNPSSYYLSDSEAERYIYSIKKIVKDVVEPTTTKAASAHGGTGRKTVSDKLKLQAKPDVYALKFILTRCLSTSMVKRYNIHYVKTELLSNRENIINRLFCYSETSKKEQFPLIEMSYVDHVIDVILQAKREVFSTEKQEDVRLAACNELLTNVSDLLIEIGQLPISCFVGQHDEDELRHYGIVLAGKAKDNLYVLLDEQDAKEVWNEIGSTVYSITTEAISITNEKFMRDEDFSGSKEEIAEVIFFYLLYSTPLISNSIKRFIDCGKI